MRVVHIGLPVILFFALAGAAMGEDASPSQPASRASRSYNRRVQMHSMPLDAQVPEHGTTERTTLGDKLKQDARSSDLAPAQTFIPPTIQPPVRREREKKDRNWIRLDSAEGTDASRTDTRARDGAGWGWLANDVLERQDTERAKAEEQEKEDDLDTFLLPTERLLRSATGQGGLVMQTMEQSSPAAGPIQNMRSPEIVGMLYLEDERAAQRTDRGSLQTPQSTGQTDRPELADGRAGAQPPEQSFFGNRADSSPRSILPQTAVLMARPQAFDNKPAWGHGLQPREGLRIEASSATSPNVFPPGQATAPLSFSSSWDRPSATPQSSMFGSFESPGQVSPGSSVSSFERDAFRTPLSTPSPSSAATPARPTVEFYGPSWRK